MHVKTGIYLLIVGLAAACANKGENNLPAKTQIENSPAAQPESSPSKQIDETIQTPQSSWISSASYSSSDGNTGNFTLRANNRVYVYEDVPFEIWEEFKQADSKGGYYNANIKGKYKRN
jgi:hypothetical protein